MNTKHSIKMNDIEFFENNIYFSAKEFNGLYLADLIGGQAKFIGTFPGERENQKDLHSKVIRYENELAFLPAAAENICVYNLDDGNFTNYKYPIEKNIMNLTNGQKVAAAILIGYEVYIFGGNNPSVLVFNFITKEIKICEKWLGQVKEYGLEQRNAYFCEDIVKLKNSIFARLCRSNIIVEYNMKEEQFFMHSISDRDYPIVNCVLAGADEKLWMLYIENDSRKVIGWNDQGVVKEIDLSEKLHAFDLAYECSALNGREIWLFPFPMNLPILILNLDTEEIRTMYLNEIDCNSEDGIGECIWFRKVYQDVIFFKTVRGNRLYCLRQNEEPVLCADTFIDRDNFANKVYDATQILYENRSDWIAGPSIDDFISLCLSHHHIAYTKDRVSGGYGKLIERYIG